MKIRAKVESVEYIDHHNVTYVRLEGGTQLVEPGIRPVPWPIGQEVEVTVTAVPAERPAARECTCVAYCKGPDGLAPGWVCGLGRKAPATPPDTGERGEGKSDVD